MIGFTSLEYLLARRMKRFTKSVFCSTYTMSIVMAMSLSVLLTSCANHEPMPPSVYEKYRPLFTNLSESLQSTDVKILYATDRAPSTSTRELYYGHKRSFNLTFGESTIKLGSEFNWEGLVDWTTRGDKRHKITPEIESNQEITIFPPTPYDFNLKENGKMEIKSNVVVKRQQSQQQIEHTITKYLDKTEINEVNVHIHGIKDSYAETLIRVGLMYHFYGRRGVPILYSWPAGNAGFLKQYLRDRESGEFTIFHLKEFLRSVSRIKGVNKINITAHSRGADIILTALRELIIESRLSDKDPKITLKIGQLILIAPDIDPEVSSQRVAGEYLLDAVDRLTIYVNNQDSAIIATKILYGGDERIGSTDVTMMTELQKKILILTNNIDVVAYSGDSGGFMGHKYYRAPAILADIFLLINGKNPGAEYGRPLKPLSDSVWEIDDDYLR